MLAKTALMVTNNDRRVGNLRNSFGELAEHLVAPGIIGRFDEIGYRFDRIKNRRLKILSGKKGDIVTEVDILLENEDTVIAVEVKSRPQADEDDIERNDIIRHVWRIEVLRKYRKDKGKPPKRILGAIAGAIFEEDVKAAALEAGFFVIAQSGDTMKMEIPEGFKPKEW